MRSPKVLIDLITVESPASTPFIHKQKLTHRGEFLDYSAPSTIQKLGCRVRLNGAGTYDVPPRVDEDTTSLGLQLSFGTEGFRSEDFFPCNLLSPTKSLGRQPKDGNGFIVTSNIISIRFFGF